MQLFSNTTNAPESHGLTLIDDGGHPGTREEVQGRVQVRGGSAHSHHARNSNSSTDAPPSSSTTTASDSSNVHHAHRQSHNSSKLPAFRFADLRKDRISLPSLQQPTPLAAVVTVCATADPRHTSAQPSAQIGLLHHYHSAQSLPASPAPHETSKQSASASAAAAAATTSAKTRSLKFNLTSSATTATAADPESVESPSSSATALPPGPASKRPASFPTNDAPAVAQSQSSPAAAPGLKRRLTESAAVKGAPPPGQRELLLPKAIETPRVADSNKKSRPPLSYKPPDGANTADVAASSSSAGRAVIPPIRSFRSSGSRKSVVLDMHTRRTSSDSYRDEPAGASQRDRTLRALEGQRDDDFSHLVPSESGEMTTTTDNDNTADIFMKIAREDPAPRALEKQPVSAEPSPSVISRIVRTSHRRPLSTAVATHETASPPQLPRRLSDQREHSRNRSSGDSHAPSASRTTGRESLPSITTTEPSVRTQSGRTPLRPSPITPRQISFKDSFAESSSAYQRRRQSLTENNNDLSGSRSPHYRNSNFAAAQARTYHSSPLVPKSANVPTEVTDANHGVEGTESSSSTAAPSTVWDELDDLKSRIHRLERTGKIPSTSGGEAISTSTLVPRETQPLLLSALGKTRDLVSAEVFNAIESAATDALALSSMIGAVGQPGPISSSASTIGGYNGGVTDRQLRKKADSVCRSLTELCLALADSTPQKKQQQQPQSTAVAVPDQELLTPAPSKAAASAVTPQRRPSAVAEMTAAKASSSDRAPTSLEQKRKTMLASISLPAARYPTAPSTPLEATTPGRKSSLLLARIRRTTTEETEESPQAGRRSSLLLRSRRAVTEEPEETVPAALTTMPREGRKTSLLLRSRKATNEEEDESRFRVPSRAITEVNSLRALPREPAAAPQSSAEQASAVLPRRRLIPSSISTRLAAAMPTSSAPTTPARKYLERGGTMTPLDRSTYLEPQQRGTMGNNISERLAEERGQQRQGSLSGHASSLLSRNNSVGRRTRESSIPGLRS
ncbi:hypothetical protein C8A05DRAFT_44606 [Staphylotrichum tortipilum]|uniref:LPXTG-motif cell wall anchor domain protein n=1 Tax=Staphylotrichum tortipilum TaxID=2831512 RepID=A0AAN6MJP2_9PEZI|nr:hypothetical protein C8A05DRAFT_44606 [Staphylotrichum longicolle]